MINLWISAALLLSLPDISYGDILKPYWQQKANYKMDIVLDEPSRSLFGVSSINYYNNSPDTLII